MQHERSTSRTLNLLLQVPNNPSSTHPAPQRGSPQRRTFCTPIVHSRRLPQNRSAGGCGEFPTPLVSCEPCHACAWRPLGQSRQPRTFPDVSWNQLATASRPRRSLLSNPRRQRLPPTCVYLFTHYHGLEHESPQWPGWLESGRGCCGHLLLYPTANEDDGTWHA